MHIQTQIPRKKENIMAKKAELEYKNKLNKQFITKYGMLYCLVKMPSKNGNKLIKKMLVNIWKPAKPGKNYL